MKPGAIFVNVSRGSLINEADLAEAVGRGHLLGAGTDVWQKLPPGPDHPFMALEGMVMTPHCAAHTEAWRCRIGIHSGAIIGSVVGVQKYVYDIFGPGANLAARLEALSRPMEITLCEDMARHLREEFQFTPRGEVELKGFGRKRIFSLESGPSMSSSPSFV